MIKTTERRMAILHILSERRKERIENLAFELGVCRNTIQRDIEILSLSFPIYIELLLRFYLGRIRRLYWKRCEKRKKRNAWNFALTAFTRIFISFLWTQTGFGNCACFAWRIGGKNCYPHYSQMKCVRMTKADLSMTRASAGSLF